MIRSLALLIGIAVAACTSAGDASGAQNTLEVKLSTPANGAVVAHRHDVSGTVSDPGVKVYLVIHPMATSGYWVQPDISSNTKGEWTTEAYFGKSESVDSGKRFEVRAFAGVTAKISVGERSDWPTATASSELIIVNRK